MINAVTWKDICEGLNDTYAIADAETGELYDSLEQALSNAAIIQIFAWDNSFGWVLIGEFEG